MLAIDGRGRRLAMLVALSGGALLSTATTLGITPFLLTIASDLNTDLAAAGNLVALQSVTWGIASLFAGAASDRLGRRPLLVAGLLAMAISGTGVAVADSYALVVVWRLIGGLGGGSFMGTVFATVLGFAGFGGLAMLTFAFGLLGGVLALARWLLPRQRARLLAARSEH